MGYLMQLPTNVLLINYRDLPEEIFRQKIVEALGVQIKLSNTTAKNGLVSINSVVQDLSTLLPVASKPEWINVFNTKLPTNVTITQLGYSINTVSASYVQSEVQTLSNKIQAISVKVDELVTAINKALILN